MATAFLLSPFDSRLLGDGTKNRRLGAELVVDLGVRVDELHEWEAETRPGGWRLEWRVRESGTGTTIIRIPAGLVYDGASIPALAQTFMGARELYEIASAFHDWLYQLGAPRGAADRVFWIVARSGEKHVNPVRAWLGWAGVRIGGGIPYDRHEKRRAKAKAQAG